jgi:phosphoserine phosphatase RsbU/P
MGFDPKVELTNLNQRLGELASRLEDAVRRGKVDKAGARGGKTIETVIHNIHDLFTHGVTHEGLTNLLRREIRETLHFYTREIDFKALGSLPRFKRYPLLAWKLFLATAYRLSPPRRIAFAIAIFSFLIGLLQLLPAGRQPQDALSGFFWWFVALVILFTLLLMELKDKLGLKGDLEVAREIQIALTPSAPYECNTVRIISRMRPANTVGGDYHDIIDLGGDRVGVVIGDVAGKGMPAALLMALLQGSLRTLVTADFRGGELIRRLNEYLSDSIPANRLVTLFYAELDTVAGDLGYTNAGHNAPFLLRGGRIVERLHTTSLVLGVLRDAAFDVREIRLEPDDRLVLFTDGVTEAFNQNDQEYGEERLGAFLQNQSASSEEELISGIVRDVLSFCDAASPGDDMTLMCVSRRQAANRADTSTC